MGRVYCGGEVDKRLRFPLQLEVGVGVDVVVVHPVDHLLADPLLLRSFTFLLFLL